MKLLCNKDQLNYSPRAYAEYQAEWAGGEDGRPDWVARKTCNYLTGSIDVSVLSSLCKHLYFEHEKRIKPFVPYFLIRIFVCV